MNLLQGVILGIVQGITEFLPVSSSGHLVLFEKIFGLNEPTVMFDVVLHLGTLVPVLIIFWGKISSLLKKPFQKYSWLIILATIPAVVVALLFGDWLESLFEQANFLWLAFILTGVILLIGDRNFSENGKEDKDILFKDALIIGLMQALAIVPGISRSGSTIGASLVCGLKKETASRFAFILSVPVIIGAIVFELKKVLLGEVNFNFDWQVIFFGFVSAMLSGYLAIKFMIKLINDRKLKFFAYYVFVLGVLILADKIVFGLYF